MHGVHELWLGAALDSRWHDEPGGDAGHARAVLVGYALLLGRQPATRVRRAASSYVQAAPTHPLIYETGIGATATIRDAHADRVDAPAPRFMSASQVRLLA